MTVPSILKSQNNLEVHIFFHDADSEAEAREWGSELDCEVRYINLESLKVPVWLEDVGAPEEIKLALSEVLGLLDARPVGVDHVGFFTYSAPRKFSHEWAFKTGSVSSFLPEFRPNSLNHFIFDSRTIWTLEDKPFFRALHELGLQTKTELLADRLGTRGTIPMKNSWVVPIDVHHRYIEAMERVLPSLLPTLLRTSRPRDSMTDLNRVTGRGSSEDPPDQHLTMRRRLRFQAGGTVERVSGAVLAKSAKELNRRNIRLERALAPNAPQKSRETDLRQPMTLVFSDFKSRALLWNWLLASEAAGIKNVTVVALDRELFNLLSGAGLRSILRPWRSTQKADIWRIRLEVIGEFLGKGQDVFLMDLDAVPLSEVKVFFESDGDVVSSQGSTWPPSALEKRKRVLCMGAVLFRSKEPVAQLIEQMLWKGARREAPFDDQRELNLALLNDIVLDFPNPDYVISLNGKAIFCNHEPVKSVSVLESGGKIEVNLLPHKLLPRVWDPNTTSYLAGVHPYSIDGTESAKQRLEKHDAWFSLGEPPPPESETT